MPSPEAHASTAEITTQAWAEALSMTCAAPDHIHPPSGVLAAAALRAHGRLSAGLGQSIPFSALGPGCGVRGLASFLAVYAAQHEHDVRNLGTAA
ncbi:hypothetical protein OG264_39225 (plasmid) [Streptomyces xanthophaeus]|uniref:hypothetical protein n=1 Tax=Streptomyces xanthophaeus TaxID=67385 RepID=UPI002F919FB4|nr:hypothetical protein OG264_39225 [Streptomyces xanthophaeus]WST65914.1 hypothetical protein OG605_40445 [Streptomyces xanthophaeus]